ncbi:MAG: hypothetical protein RI964_3082 [Pseudomonadota bacterium]|jgi:hypothetical protein
MRYSRTFLLSLISSALCAAPAFAADAVAEMPQPLNDFFQTESVFTQEAGEWEVKVGGDFTKNDAHKTTELSTGLEYGITDSVQVELDHTPYIHIKPADADEATLDGQGNTSVGLKKSWMNLGGSPTSVAVGYEHAFANGDAEVIADDDEEASDSDEVYVTVARDLDEVGNNQASLQIGSEHSTGSHQSFANLAAFHASGNHVLTGEYNWSKEEKWVTPGVFWKPSKGLEVGAGIGFGVGNTDGERLMTRLNYEWD